MEDSDLMPFGKFKGKKMADVPAVYLSWLHDYGSSGIRSKFPQVFDYIKDNMDVIEMELKSESNGYKR